MTVRISGGVNFNPKINTTGLVFAFDAASRYSYSGSGTTIEGLSEDVQGKLVNGASFSSSNYGFFSIDGTDDYISTNKIKLNRTSATLCLMMKMTGSSTSPQVIAEFSSNYNLVTDGFLITYQDQPFGYSEKSIVILRKGNVGINARGFAVTHLSDQKWKYCSFIFDESLTVGRRNQLWINGEYQTPSEPQGSFYNKNNTNDFGEHSLFIGGRDGAVAVTQANIACCHMYNRVLTQKELKTNYLALKTRFGL